MHNPELIRKLGIGTAQFGLDYGISNTRGKFKQVEVNEILNEAKKNGIDLIDTASLYGDSEYVIGQSNVDLRDFSIVSKCPKDILSKNKIIESLLKTLKNLGISNLYGYLAHDFNSIQNEEFYNTLQQLKSDGKVSKIGVSVYYPWQVEWILNNIKIDMIQLPFNVFDQRFRYLFEILKSKNIEIHIRSVFLQGLFFLPVNSLSNHFKSVKKLLKGLCDLTNKYNLSMSSMLLNFCLNETMIDKIIIGVSSVSEFYQNLESIRINDLGYPLLNEELSRFEIKDESILLPFNWK